MVKSQSGRRSVVLAAYPEFQEGLCCPIIEYNVLRTVI